MKSSMKFSSVLVFFFFCLSACTFGDKGREGIMDSTKIDTSKKPGIDVGVGTGAVPPAVNAGKDTVAKDSVKTDSASKAKP